MAPRTRPGAPSPTHRLPRPHASAGAAPASTPTSPVVRLFRPGRNDDDDTTRPALVFLPGTDGTSHGLDTQVAGLAAAGWEVHAARYEAEDVSWAWPAAVAAVASAIARLREGGRRPVLLVGESFGACLALRVAAAQAAGSEDGPAALALINPATAFPRALGGAPALLARSGLLGIVPGAAYGIAQRILLPLLVDRGRTGAGGEVAAGLMMEMKGGASAPSSPSRPAAAASHRLGLMVDTDGLDDAALATIRVPTLLIASGGDALLPSLSEAARLEWLIPGAGASWSTSSAPRRARLVLPDSGHAPLLEAGIDLAALLEAGGLGPREASGAVQPTRPPPPSSLPPPPRLPPWARPDPAVDAACEALSPLRALISPLVSGASNLPTPTGAPGAGCRPLLFVANHARYGLYDLPFLVSELYARGVRVRGVAHPTHWRGPLGPQFERLGAIRSSPRALLRALTGGEACLLFPGGGREVTKRRGADYTLCWRDSPDLVRLAARANALIIPLASVGADDAYTLLADAEDILENPLAGPAVRAALGRLFPGPPSLVPEETVFPISALPMPSFLPSIIPAPIPIPRPARLYFEVGAPVDAAAEVEAAGGGVEGARVVYGRVKAAVEAGIARQLAVREADADGLRSWEARAGRVRKRWLG